MGGNVPLGYDADERALVINPAEAETVRRVFALYREQAPADWHCGRSGRGCWQTPPHPHRWSPLSCSYCRAFCTTAF